MSMPSSRLDVATTQGSSPALSSSSMSVRCSRDIDAVVGLRDHGGAPAADAGLRHRLGGEGVQARDRLESASSAASSLSRAVKPLGQPPGVGEHDRRAVLPDQVQEPPLHRRPDRRPLRRPGGRADDLLVRRPRRRPLVQRRQVRHRHLDGHLDRLGGGGLHDLHRPGPGQERRHLVERPDGRRQPDPLGRRAASSASSRSSDSARCAPRLVPATACTSSRITVRTPRNDSRAAEVSSRNSDSGRGDQDVRRRAGEQPPLVCRGVAGTHPDRDLGWRRAGPLRRLPDARERRTQVALHVDRQGLERRHVEHPAAVSRIRRRAVRRQPVQRPQERRKRLARAGRRDHERVPPRLRRRPRPLLGGRGRREGAHGTSRGWRGRSRRVRSRNRLCVGAPTVCVRAGRSAPFRESAGVPTTNGRPS